MDSVCNQKKAKKKKRVQYKSYAPAMMDKAMLAVQSGDKTVYRAAKDFKVPMNTLRDRLVAKGLVKPKRSAKKSETSADMKSTKARRDKRQSHISVDSDVIDHWRDIGKTQGLTTNSAIISFLVSMYYRVEKQDHKAYSQCQECQNPLTLICLNCQTVSPASPIRQTSSNSAGNHVNKCVSVTESESATSLSNQSLTVQSDIKTEVDNHSLSVCLRPERSMRSRAKHKEKAQTLDDNAQPTARSKVTEVSFDASQHVLEKQTEIQPSFDGSQSEQDDNNAYGGWSETEDQCREDDFADNKNNTAMSIDDLLLELEDEVNKKSRLRTYECPQCGETFLEPNGLQQHLEETKHNPEYVCKQCSKSFKNKSAIQQHMRVHSRQEHQCPTCGLSFKFPSRLTKHLKTHGTERPHVCDKCGKSFVSVYYLRDHIKIHSEERCYKCQQCGAAFKQKPALYAHAKKHTNHKPFQCQYCGLKFRDSQKVKIHVRTHTGEKPYQCAMCDASFVSNSNMWQHCAYVHGKSTKTHPCPHCPLTFAAKGKLKVHIKNSHSIEGTEPESSCRYEEMRPAFYIELQGQRTHPVGGLEFGNTFCHVGANL